MFPSVDFYEKKHQISRANSITYIGFINSAVCNSSMVNGLLRFSGLW